MTSFHAMAKEKEESNNLLKIKLPYLKQTTNYRRVSNANVLQIKLRKC